MNNTNNSEFEIQLVHIDGPRKGQIDELQQPRIAIGRGNDCDVTMPADLRMVSRHHADIVREGNRFLFLCRGRNGCLVNGQVTDQAYLKSGDVITLAEGGPKFSFLSRAINIPANPTRPTLNTGTGSVPSLPSTPAISPTRTASVEENFTFQYGVNVKSMKKTLVCLGRGPQADFQIQHPGVYEQHLEIKRQGDDYILRDLSHHHTYINQRCITQETLLYLNDVIMLGDGGPQITFVGEGRFVESQARTAQTPAANDIDSQILEDIESHKAFRDAPQPPPRRGFLQSLFRR